MKKIIAVVMLVTLILCTFSMNVLGARSLTDDEKKLVEELKGREVLGQKVSAADITAFENYLMGTDEPLSAASVDSIITDMDEVVATIKATGAKSVAELPKDVKDKVVNIAQSAASVAGLSIAITPASANGGVSAVTITDKKTGAPVVMVQEQPIKKTGLAIDMTTIILNSLMIILSAAVITAAIILRRTNKSVVTAQN